VSLSNGQSASDWPTSGEKLLVRIQWKNSATCSVYIPGSIVDGIAHVRVRDRNCYTANIVRRWAYYNYLRQEVLRYVVHVGVFVNIKAEYLKTKMLPARQAWFYTDQQDSSAYSWLTGPPVFWSVAIGCCVGYRVSSLSG